MIPTRKFLLLLITLLFLVFPVFAHPGGTDGSGGHTNRSTGEYHYHHGYEAHSHYDMDGDGNVDCPFDFKDTVDRDRNYVSSRNPWASYSYTQEDYKDTTESVTVRKESEEVPSWVYWTIGALSLLNIILLVTIRSKNKTMQDQQRQFNNRTEEEKNRVIKGLSGLHTALQAHYGNDYLYQIADAPKGDFLDEDLKPHSIEALDSAPCDKYTFFLGGGSSSNFHRKSCRYASLAYRINAYSLKQSHRYRPCHVCWCKLPDTSWVGRYLSHYFFLSNYIDMQSAREPCSLPTEDTRMINWRK